MLKDLQSNDSLDEIEEMIEDTFEDEVFHKEKQPRSLSPFSLMK